MSLKAKKRSAETATRQLIKRASGGNLIFAVTGNRQGVVEVSGNPLKIYVMLGGEQTRTVEAFWDLPNPLPNLGVLVEQTGQDEYFVRRFATGIGMNTSPSAGYKLPLPYMPPVRVKEQLANADDVTEISQPSLLLGIPNITANVNRGDVYRPAYHAPSHYISGPDPIMVRALQIMDFKPSPTAPPTFQVVVHSGLLANHRTGEIYSVKTQYIQCDPPTLIGQRYDYLLLLDREELGQLVYERDLRDINDPVVLKTGISSRYFPIAYIKVIKGLSYITDKEILDIRSLYISGSPSVTPHPLAVRDGIHIIEHLIEDEYIESHQTTAAEKDKAANIGILAVTLGDEIEQIRYIITKITGKSLWYQLPNTSIEGLPSYLEGLDLSIIGHWSFEEGNLSLPVADSFPETPMLGEIVLLDEEVFCFNGQDWMPFNISQGHAGRIKLSADDPCLEFLKDKLVPQTGIRVSFRPQEPQDVYVSNCHRLYISAPGSHVHVYNELYQEKKQTMLTINSFEPETLQLYKNGQLLAEGLDYTVNTWYDGFTLADEPLPDDKLVSSYLAQLV